jgi:hypothetical protein
VPGRRLPLRGTGITRLLAAFAIVSALDTIGPDATPAAAQGAACAASDADEWSQSVCDADPGAHAALDPDGDGIASPELPCGAASALAPTADPAAEPAPLAA